mgnify:CR=1 FL=1
MAENIYDIKINDLKGNELNLSAFKGKKWMIVNVASECGFTNQYAQLEELHKNHQDSLTILGCPCNDFGGQEPGGSDEIEQFCSINFGVTFTLTEKLNISQDPHPLYQFLCNKEKNGKKDYQIFWNFQKLLKKLKLFCGTVRWGYLR